MNIVNESNLGKIKSVFNDNASNSHYYKIIHKKIQGVLQNLEFAKPIIQINKGTIVWQADTDGPYLNYTSLDQEGKQYIDELIQGALNKLATTLEGISDKGFLENIIEIPDENAIFYTKDLNNNISIILTEWGYTKDEHIKREGVLKKIFSATMKSFIIKFKSNKNEFLEGINAVILSENLNFQGTSNKEGVIKINNLKKGNTIAISSPEKSFQEVKLKLNTIEEYVIVVQRNYTLTFNIINSNGIAVANENFSFKSELFKNRKFKTDSNGVYEFEHPEKDGDFQIFSNKGDELLYSNLPSENKTYTITYDLPIMEEPINIEKPLLERNIELEFLNRKRKPIVNQPIDIYGLNGKTSYTTDTNGIVSITSLNKDIEYGVFMNYKKTSWKQEFKHTDKRKYTFIVKQKRILWWWLPFVFFFLLLLLIPTEVVHDYTVIDKKTKQAIDLAEVSSSELSVYQVQSNNHKTDSLGKSSIKYGKYPLYKQIFNNQSTDIFIQKPGYESLNAKVSLSYFNTQESIIYLNKLSLPVFVEPIIPCGGGENYNNTGNQIKRFDLGESNADFLFEYYNDTALDIITVYCDDGTALFKVDTVTNTSSFQDSKIINAPCRYIYVEVVGQTNWGIRVNCPR
ncbi:hypothetical protein MPF19_16600 [Polaribacter sp. Z014]|uniref:hypothetical protein n=1 Tax=Polaribacter sp. Z014 TaxID=2927126 RepID=UPI0020216BDC|nr:hypothetical protein [Polaribacter sp. Z014]MCL7765045.1 hypothetical protein [Polaribacter sp. Z014]